MPPIRKQLGRKFRLTGITFRGGPQGEDQNGYNRGTVAIGGDAHDLRLDHLKFDRPNSAAIRFYGDVWGVVDHVTFNLQNHVQGVVIWHDGWGGEGGEFGDRSFAEGTHLGTEQGIYVEDSVFTGAGVAGAGALDAFAGARFVFRHNRVIDDLLTQAKSKATGALPGAGAKPLDSFKNIFGR